MTTSKKNETGLLGLAIRGLLFGTAYLIKFHIMYPLHFVTAYLTLFLLLPLGATALRFSHGSLGAGLIALVVLGLIVLMWKYLYRLINNWNARLGYAQHVRNVMAETLWKDMKPSKFVKVAPTSMKGVWKVDFQTPMGYQDEDIVKILPKFRSALRLSDTILLADENPYDGLVSVLFCDMNPLETRLESSAAPVLNLTPEELADPYHWLGIGIDANGSSYDVPLFLEEGGSVRQLCAGQSGSGKSSIVRQQILQAVLNPFIDVAIFDGKGSEFGIFKPYVQSFGTSTGDFWTQLRFIEDEIARRGKVLNENKLNQENRSSQSWNPKDDGNFLLWVWDEIGATMAGFDMKQKHEAMTRLYGALSVARSLGVGAIFSSQTFKSDLLTTQIRDNCFDVSLGFKMNSAQEAAYIGFDPSDDITPAAIKGKIQKSGKSSTVGTFAMKGIDRNAYGRSYFISDQQIKRALSALRPAELVK